MFRWIKANEKPLALLVSVAFAISGGIWAYSAAKIAGLRLQLNLSEREVDALKRLSELGAQYYEARIAEAQGEAHSGNMPMQQKLATLGTQIDQLVAQYQDMERELADHQSRSPQALDASRYKPPQFTIPTVATGSRAAP